LYFAPIFARHRPFQSAWLSITWIKITIESGGGLLHNKKKKKKKQKGNRESP
jgi:hypothetical protein